MKESKAKIARVHIPKPKRRALVTSHVRRGSVLVRHASHAKKARAKGRLVAAPIGQAGVEAAARQAGIKLSGKFGL